MEERKLGGEGREGKKDTGQEERKGDPSFIKPLLALSIWHVNVWYGSDL